MTSRDAILAALRRAPLDAGTPPADGPAPTPEVPTVPLADPKARFVEMLEAAGGRAVEVASEAEIDGKLATMAAFAGSSRRCSLVRGAGRPNVDPGGVEDAHSLHDVGFALLRGELAVAENGAVWVTDGGLRHRALLHLAEHVGLVVPVDDIVVDLQAAYARLSSEGAFERRGFGCFVSGPSKTADIEQALVMGAQGPRSLTVFLLRRPAPEA